MPSLPGLAKHQAFLCYFLNFFQHNTLDIDLLHRYFDANGQWGYTLFDFTGASLSDFDLTYFAFGDTIAGYDYSLGFVGSSLQVTAVPEPGAGLLLALVALASGFHRQRRLS